MLAFSKAPHIKLGWLWKLARHRNTFGMRNWKKRYITLNTKSRVLSYYKSNVDFEKEFEIIATSNLVKSKKSKDRAGEATNLTLEIIVDLDVFQNGKKIKKITINENTNYNNNDNKFELKQFEKILINDLVNKIIYRIDLNLSSI